MKLAFVTVVTANLEPMRTFLSSRCEHRAQQIYRGNDVEFPLKVAPWRSGASPSVQRLGLLRCTAPRMPVSSLSLRVADVDAEYARLHGLPGGVGPSADDPALGPSRLLRT